MQLQLTAVLCICPKEPSAADVVDFVQQAEDCNSLAACSKGASQLLFRWLRWPGKQRRKLKHDLWRELVLLIHGMDTRRAVLNNFDVRPYTCNAVPESLVPLDAISFANARCIPGY